MTPVPRPDRRGEEARRPLERWAMGALSAFFAAGALLVALVTAVSGRDRPALALGGAACAAALAVVLAARRASPGEVLRHVALLLGTGLIGLVVVSSGRAELGDEVLFVWVGLYGGFFTQPRALAGHLLAVAAACVGALVLGADGMPWGEVAGRSIDVVGATVAAAGCSAVLRGVVDRSIAVEARRADTDALSGLANRRQLDRLGATLDRQARPFTVVAVDLDSFKSVNDRYGHAVGDALLRAVGERLRRAVSSRDVVARSGGDEFVVVLDGVGAVDGAAVAGRIVELLSRRYSFDGVQIEGTASVGFASSAGGSFRRTLERADRMMYRDKDGGERPLRRLEGVEGPGDGIAPAAAELQDAARSLASLQLPATLEAGDVHAVFQPIVALDTGTVVAFEALARGPGGTPLATASALFAAARAAGPQRELELEWLCRARALEGASELLPAGAAVFVNVEPASLHRDMPEELAALVERVARERRVVVELTERSLVRQPAAVMRAVERFRALGCAIALDDVGADPRSVALIPYVRPDVIKLDLRLVQHGPTPALAATVHAVSAAAERSGAVLLAEGIETDEHLHVAQALGATHGQGWHFGRPTRERHPGRAERGWPAAGRTRDDGPPGGGTPYELVSSVVATRVATKRTLYSISKYLEHHLASQAEASVLLSTFQQHEHFSEATRRRYARLGQTTAFAAVFAEGMPVAPVDEVRGVALTSEEPLRVEWDVVVVTPHLAAAFVARDLGDEGGDDWERRFEYALTYDRELAVRASAALMRRVLDDHEQRTSVAAAS